MKVAKKREALLEHQIEKEKKRDEREEEGKRRKVVGQWEWLKNIVFY
jgi:nitric oxide synthase oxygenase domain/subunit